MSTAKLYFIAATYFATGEGMTVATMITLANPRTGRDFETDPSFDMETGTFDPGVLKHTQEEIALTEFREQFKGLIGLCAEVLPEQEFMDRYSSYLPPAVTNFIDQWNEQGPNAGNYRWHGEMHVNYS